MCTLFSLSEAASHASPGSQARRSWQTRVGRAGAALLLLLLIDDKSLCSELGVDPKVERQH